MAPEEESDGLTARLRRLLRRRGAPATLALAIEALLIGLLLTLNHAVEVPKPAGSRMESVSFAAAKSPAEGKKAPAVTPRTSPNYVNSKRPEEAPTPQPQPLPPPLILVPKDTMASLDISRLPQNAPQQPSKPKAMFGPAAPVGQSGSASDSAVVGLAPDGSPLYAARWVHAPYASELRGYLQTTDGPGWGLIACRTVPGQRVEDCEALDESPAGSRIAAAIVGAAWQFRVWPPRKDGKYLVGSWVRIKIDYDIKRKAYGP